MDVGVQMDAGPRQASVHLEPAHPRGGSDREFNEPKTPNASAAGPRINPRRANRDSGSVSLQEVFLC